MKAARNRQENGIDGVDMDGGAESVFPEGEPTSDI